MGDVRDDECVCGASLVEPGTLHHWLEYAFAIAPDGEVVGEFDRTGNDEGLLIADIQANRLADSQMTSGDFLKEHCPEIYGRILKK